MHLCHCPKCGTLYIRRPYPSVLENAALYLGLCHNTDTCNHSQLEPVPSDVLASLKSAHDHEECHLP